MNSEDLVNTFLNAVTNDFNRYQQALDAAAQQFYLSFFGSAEPIQKPVLVWHDAQQTGLPPLIKIEYCGVFVAEIHIRCEDGNYISELIEYWK